MDLSKLSDEDLMALKAGDLTKVSDAGLMAMRGEAPKAEAPKESPGPMSVLRGWRDYAAGLIPGAGTIGSTLIEAGRTGGTWGQSPGTLLDRIKSRNSDQERAAAGLTGADTESAAFGAGKLTSQVAGTMGVGPALAGGAKALGASPMLTDALATGGFRAAGATGVPAWLTRIAGGGVTGGASTALVDPENADKGALLGAILPVAAKLSGEAGNAVRSGTNAAAKKLMQSAIKPTLQQLKTGEADVAIETLLKYGINPTKGGVEKLKALVDQKNAQIASEIAASSALIDKQKVIAALDPVRNKFGTQVTPAKDLAAIQEVSDAFMAHPRFPGASIPVQDAQKLKQGTYRVLSGKYGQLGSAETEAQKGLARGLKEEIGAAVPSVVALNAEESALLKTLSVAERRSLMELNKNPMGLAALAGSPTSWALFMADKSAAFKALAARAVNSSGSGGAGLLSDALANPALRNAGLLSLETSP